MRFNTTKKYKKKKNIKKTTKKNCTELLKCFIKDTFLSALVSVFVYVSLALLYCICIRDENNYKQFHVLFQLFSLFFFIVVQIIVHFIVAATDNDDDNHDSILFRTQEVIDDKWWADKN